MKLRGTETLVVGMKRSGIAAVELLVREGAKVRATDLKPLNELPEAAAVLERLHVPFAAQAAELGVGGGELGVGGRGSGVGDGAGVSLIVLSPDVPADLAPIVAARARGVKVIGEIELAAPFLKGRNIGITGSNGKTTTTSLIGHILREAGVASQVGGNIGRPAAAMIESSRADGWNVFELSSFQLETIFEFRAQVALALNVTQNHLDRHHTFENYAAAKGRLFETQLAEDHAVLNADDATCVGYAKLTRAHVNWFSGTREVAPGAFRRGGELILDGQRLMAAEEIPIRGRHNAENVLAAAIAAARVGVSHAAIAAAVRTFRAVEHRLEFVRRVSGIDFYNDSKATSVDATLKALDAFSGGLWVILGGKDKGLDYAPLRAPLAQKAHAAVLIGAAASKIAAQLDGALPLVDAHTLEAAIAHAYSHGAAGDTVLLAPACASFDQFRSFEHRGETFKQIVNTLEAKN